MMDCTSPLLLQVDGVEDAAVGLDLFELSDVLVKLGAWHAIVSSCTLRVVILVFILDLANISLNHLHDF